MRSWWMVLAILLAVYEEVTTEENYARGDIPENPDEEDLHTQTYNATTLNAFNRIISLNTNTSVEVTGSGNRDSCEYRAPDGNTYLFSDSMQYPGVYIPNVGNSIICRIVIGPIEETMLGEWHIIGKFSSNGILTEIIQPFTLIKEEHVEAFPQEVTISEDNDIYVRLKYSTDQYRTCRLVGPRGENNSPHYIDKPQAQSCGYVIKSIKTADQGVWQIVYGTNIIYRAFIHVTVLAKDVSVTEDLVLIEASKVNKTIGPYDAVYCRLEDPHGFTMFDRFGSCQLTIERVTMEHSGYWKIFIDSPGSLLLEEFSFRVIVREAERKVIVSTNVELEEPSVLLSCSVPNGHTVRACKFRDSKGNTLIAVQGIGEDRLYYESEVRYESNVSNHECGIRIINPTQDDIGLWRCEIEIGRNTHYGFILVICPWLIQDADVNATVVTEPTLTADKIDVNAIEGENVIMSCSIQSPIRYCYFRSRNGIVYTVTPQSSTTMEYVGNGFEAGECGIRLTGLTAKDSGPWYCHVGLDHKVEQKVEIYVTVQEPITAYQLNDPNKVFIEAFINLKQLIEYCRFIRYDGLGFTYDNVPNGYTFFGSLDRGCCNLDIQNATYLDLYPWTVVAMIRGYGELSKRTELIWKKPEIDGGLSQSQTSTEWLPRIDRVTRTGQLIDIALNNINQTETCYFITPSGQDSTQVTNIAGVTVQTSCNFVSCRITVGPMDRSLLGVWTICGTYDERVRCQNVNITWLNTNNAGAGWQVFPQSHFDHPVNLDGYLRLTVSGAGTTRSCHVVTPFGEDLVITSDSHYPGIHLETVSSTSVCAISIGPIQRWMLGEWTVYGKFRRQTTTETRLPMTLFLYDEENPYDQPYNVTNLNPINRISNMGSSATLEVRGSGAIDSCQYRAPNGVLYQFSDSEHFFGVSIPDVENDAVCRLSIGPLEEVMFGDWVIMGKFSGNGIFAEINQPFTLVQGAGEAFPDVDPEWLPQIDHITRTDQFVDIALNNIGHEEICYFENPAGGQGNNEIGMYGVTVHESSEFVSCRITVGPMESSFVGTWTLCGRHGENNQYKRCQRVNIAWLNNNNPSATWQVSQQTLFDHSVNLGGYLRPAVNGSGTIISCHVVTPRGEDLVITSNSRYPGIQLEAVSSTSLCAVSIGPIDRWMLGEWTVYGRFRRQQVTSEARLPMTVSLYDEENPYDQPYNVTNLNPVNRISNLGSSTTMEVAGSGNIDSCQYRAPNGELYQFTDIAHFQGVTIPDVANVIVCRISIGPIEEVMLGEWQLVGKFSRDGIFTEIRQPFTLIRGAGEEFPDVEPVWLPQIDRVTRTGQFVDIALYNIAQDEVCYFENPAGGQGNNEIEMYGVKVHKSSEFVSCRITVGPMESSLLGTWTLCGRYGDNNQYKRCQRVNIAWLNSNNPGATWQVSQQALLNHSVSIGRYLRPTVSGAGTTRSCHVVTPYGEDLVITSDTQYPGIHLETVSSTSMCAISIGPIQRWMLGEWTVYGKFRRQATTETRLPMNLILYDEDNPYDQPYNITNLNPVNRISNLGSSTTMEVAGSGNIDSCQYRAPNGELYQFTDIAHFQGVTIPDVANVIVCRISIGPIEEVMLGEWQLIGKFSGNGIFTEIRQPFTLIRGAEEVLPDVEPMWLPQIDHVTRTGQFVDIALNNIQQDEICTFENPSGGQGNSEIDMYGVTVQRSSEFVACRITVGPMESSLLGTWILCGRYGEVNQYKRCQRVNIEWLNTNSPGASWQVSQQQPFTHSVSLGGSLRPTVSGAGTTRSCHVVTPYGEDLVITSDARYPGIQLDTVTSTSMCAVNIGPIQRWMLGEWTIYGKFRRQVTTETRLPITVVLYDEEDPYTQPYNVTTLNAFNRIVSLNTNTSVEVTGSGNRDSCEYRAPDGNTYLFSDSVQYPGVYIPNVGNSIICRIVIGPIEEIMLGDWQIMGKFSSNGIFTEIRQPFTIIEEDPDNPVIEDRIIQNLSEINLNTNVGSRERVTISEASLTTPETCHIRTPTGRQYIMSESFNVTGVTPLTGSGIECGVIIEILSEDMVGAWTLISRVTSPLGRIERRLPFILHVEDQVDAFPREVTITEHNNLFVRLRNPTEEYETCRLVGPRGSNNSPHEIDVSHTKSCGYIIKDIQMIDQGVWQIVYGSRIVYRASINVTVNARGASFIEDLVLIKDSKVNKTIGPYDAVYCRLEDPHGFPTFDRFGSCQLTTERVTMEHSGYWKIFIGSPGRVLLEEFNFRVSVEEAESNIVVVPRVERQAPSVVLSCSVSDTHTVRACKFRDPKGNVLIAAQGIGEDRYSFYGSEVRYESNVSLHECGVRITNPSQDDLGLWRCAMETEKSTHYGFLSVICPWLMQDPEIQASVVTEPTLTADRSNVTAVEGESVIMSCSVLSPIRYCYFRASNGTVYSVTPDTSSPTEYVGSGFDAGECGVRFRGLMSRDSGRWSCHVGLSNGTEEQRVQIDVAIQEPMTVRHYWHESHGLVAEAFIHSDRHLEYCRFIRFDGLGFVTGGIPDGYKFIGSLDNGHCLLQIQEASMLNLHPWTIVARIRGQGVELFRQTNDNLLWTEPVFSSLPIFLWCLIIFVAVIILMLGTMLGPKKNRSWTYDRASQFRTSIRNSFRKMKGAQTA